MFGIPDRNNGSLSSEQSVFLARVGIAAVQALGLYTLQQAALPPLSWPASSPAIAVPLNLLFVYIPLLLLLGAGTLPRRPLAIWACCCAIVVAGIGYWTVARGVAPIPLFWANFKLPLALFSGLFVANVLAHDSILAKHPLPAYAAHFDTAWKQAVQAILSITFLGVFWGILQLGASLFSLIKIDAFEKLIAHGWFADPATTIAIAVAIHVTDVQPALIRGARTLALTLFSWLLPLLALITAAFLGLRSHPSRRYGKPISPQRCCSPQHPS